MAFIPGDTVGPYRIIAPLGRGGMATVFKAYDTALDRDVAIKVLHTSLGDDRNFLERFKREAKIVGRLNHPHIVPVYDFSQEDNQLYLVMSYIEGTTLKEEMKQGAMSLERVLEVMKSVGSALTYAHGQGVLHRDIKPSNVMITTDGKVYLADFGLAKMAETSETTLSRDMMIGTPHYISPEQAQSETLDARADVYSLGAMLFEMLTGRVPFEGDTPYEVIHHHIFSPLPSPRMINPDVPYELERVLLRALQKKPNDRYSSVQEMIDDLEQNINSILRKRAKRRKAVARTPAPQATPPRAASPAPPAVSAKSSRLRTLPQKRVKIAKEKTPKRKKARGDGWTTIFIVLLFLFIIVAGTVAVLWFTPQGRAILEDILEAAYRAVIEIDDDHIGARLGLGDVLLAKSLKTGAPLDEALAHYQHVLNKDPQNFSALMRSGRVKFYQQDWPASAQYFQASLELGQDSAWAHLSLGRNYLHHGKVEEAQRELERALQMDDNLPEAHYAMGVFYSVMGQGDNARAELQWVIDSGRANAWLRQMVDQEMRQLEDLR